MWYVLVQREAVRLLACKWDWMWVGRRRGGGVPNPSDVNLSRDSAVLGGHASLASGRCNTRYRYEIDMLVVFMQLFEIDSSIVLRSIAFIQLNYLGTYGYPCVDPTLHA
jgi:hypothetical protein